jgi:hypothetical protein
MAKLTVKDLIVKLQTLDPTATVISLSTNFELGSCLIDAIVVETRGTKVKETFHDHHYDKPYKRTIYIPHLESDKPGIKLVQIIGI